MVARITFRSEVYVYGDDLDEIREKWENLPIFSVDALEKHYADVVEVVSVEDANTFDDLTDKF